MQVPRTHSLSTVRVGIPTVYGTSSSFLPPTTRECHKQLVKFLTVKDSTEETGGLRAEHNSPSVICNNDHSSTLKMAATLRGRASPCRLLPAWPRGTLSPNRGTAGFPPGWCEAFVELLPPPAAFGCAGAAVSAAGACGSRGARPSVRRHCSTLRARASSSVSRTTNGGGITTGGAGRPSNEGTARTLPACAGGAGGGGGGTAADGSGDLPRAVGGADLACAAPPPPRSGAVAIGSSDGSRPPCGRPSACASPSVRAFFAAAGPSPPEGGGERRTTVAPAPAKGDLAPSGRMRFWPAPKGSGEEGGAPRSTLLVSNAVV